ncbi:hypothetical protein CsSME_00023868 [Camellia sinensis var. sinensis]
MEEYNIAMKKMMRNPYEYHHDLGMNYTLITDKLIVGSQPQKPEDIDHLKREEDVAYILNLQQDRDIEYWEIDLKSIIKRCRDLEIRHMRRPINTCNGMRCGETFVGPNSPNKPSIWTENWTTHIMEEQILEEQPQIIYQQAYVFQGQPGQCAAFLVNNDGRNDVQVMFQNSSYELPRKSISILPDCKTVAFNTAKASSEIV